MNITTILGVLKGFLSLGITVDKIDEQTQTLYIAIPEIKDSVGNIISAEDSAKKIKAILSGVNVKYRKANHI